MAEAVVADLERRFGGLRRLYGDGGYDRQLDLPSAQARYPALAGALAELQTTVVPTYEECTDQAMVEQNRHRRQQVLLITGGLLTTTFGLLQAAMTSARSVGLICGQGPWSNACRAAATLRSKSSTISRVVVNAGDW